MKDQKLKREIPSEFLFRRYVCGMCENGIKFQSAWMFSHELDGGYGMTSNHFSNICKQCAPTREQLIFVSLSFNKENMKKYIRTYHYM